MPAIANVHARMIFDSRGNPTVEVEVTTESGFTGRAAVPSGASTGEYEAYELRDGDKSRYMGKGVSQAVEFVKSEIHQNILGMDVRNQSEIDSTLIELDGTANKSRFGANAILGVSVACAKAASEATNLPLYRYLGGTSASRLPMPFMNVINGGAHADTSVDFQEFMIVPIGAPSFSEAMRWGSEIFHNLKAVLKSHNLATTVGDEGGFAPSLKSNKQALDILLQAVESAGYKVGTEIAFALDVAASELFNSGSYHLKGEGKTLSREDLTSFYKNLCSQYPIISIEDPFDQNDWEGFKALTKEIGNKVQIVGDDIFVTNVSKLKTGIEMKAGNSILLKINQVGTLTETIAAYTTARSNHFTAMVSHRSGETEDTTIADLAVALGCGQIKTGSCSRTDRLAKYNQLLRIEDELGSQAIFLPPFAT